MGCIKPPKSKIFARGKKWAIIIGRKKTILKNKRDFNRRAY